MHIRAVVHPSLLAGKLFDGSGMKMTASHASKGTRRYRYYVSARLQHGGDAANTDGMRIPASEIETLVLNKLAELFDDPIALMEKVAVSPAAPDTTAKAVVEGRKPSQKRCVARSCILRNAHRPIVQRIDIATDAVTIILNSREIARRLGIAMRCASDQSATDGSRADETAIPTSLRIMVAAKLKRTGMAMRLILPSGEIA
ncbi:MAG: hypothetical protein M9905_04850 [Rhizobiaceae bacterium]|nr:hypothetical protein [Rhizobiaceae bacterium]